MLDRYVDDRIVDTFLTQQEIEDSQGTVNIMMGQTFDAGQPVDMVKYALFMMELSDRLEEKGCRPNATWLLADHFMTEINSDKGSTKADREMQRRIAYLEALNQTYGGRIGMLPSSQLSRTQQYTAMLARVQGEVEQDPEFKAKLMKTIPEDRRGSPGALQYPIEELTTILTMDTDIKVGPPYEALYDRPARESLDGSQFKRYSGVYLTRAFPFGNPDLRPKVKEGIEMFGILPYKKDSKDLGKYRIDPMNDSMEKVERLLRETKDQRAVDDLVAICSLAGKRLGTEFNVGELAPQRKTEMAARLYEETIYRPIEGARIAETLRRMDEVF
ncbi:TPA: hypothetical protein HA265_00260 [Candidatus Woesearchaeota archaeon]|nr:hypothetical protein [Candidatus Woesearchaeota archaeon]